MIYLFNCSYSKSYLIVDFDIYSTVYLIASKPSTYSYASFRY